MTGIRQLPSMLTAFHWNPHKLSPQGSFCCPFIPFFGQDTNRLGRCGSILILAISLLIALVRIHNSHQTVGPCPTSLVIPLHKWTRTFNDHQWPTYTTGRFGNIPYRKRSYAWPWTRWHLAYKYLKPQSAEKIGPRRQITIRNHQSWNKSPWLWLLFRSFSCSFQSFGLAWCQGWVSEPWRVCRSRTPLGSHILSRDMSKLLLESQKWSNETLLRHFCDVQTKSKKSVLVGIRVNVDMSLWISKAFQGGASNVQLLVTPDLMFEKGLNPRSKKVPQGKVWNGGYPSKLSSYLHEQRSPCCPILPFFGQDASRLGRCHSRFILIESTIAIRH